MRGNNISQKCSLSPFSGETVLLGKAPEHCRMSRGAIIAHLAFYFLAENSYQCSATTNLRDTLIFGASVRQRSLYLIELIT